MRNVFIFFAFLIAGMAQAQIITNVDKLRIRDVEQGLDSDKILVIDSGNVVRWIDAIEIDLSDYYTISEVDAFVADLEAELLERYTKDEVDALLDGLELRLDDYYTKTEVDSIITNINDRIDSLELEVEQIDLNTVTSVDNVTSIKIRGSDIFTNNLETDFAQIADVNKAGFGLISMQSEMKIGLVAKDGTTLLDDVDVSWLASGDLAVTIDDTDPNNPELVFSQNGVEVARIPASTLLSGVARSANLSNYILQFKDGTGVVVYSVNLEPLFEDYFTKAEANARFALRTRTITGTGSLTGGGNLTANRTIDLSSTTKSDIGKGLEAYDISNKAILTEMVSGNTSYVVAPNLDNISVGSYTIGLSQESINSPFSVPRSLIRFGGNRESLLTDIIASENAIAFRNVGNNTWREIWHSGNFTPSDYYTKTESNDRFATKTELNTKENAFSKNTAFNKNFGTGSNDVARGNHTHTFASLTNKPTTLSGFGITDGVPNSRTITGTGGLTGGGNLTANRTIGLSTDTQEDIAKGVEAYNLSNKAILTEMVSGNTSTVKSPDLNNIPNGSYTIGLSQESINSPFSVPRSLIRFGGNRESLLTDIIASENAIAFRNVGNNTWRELWHTSNFTPSDYVQKVAGKGLSSNDFTNTLKSKLDGIESQATKNRPDSQNAGKTENNTFTGNNTFTKPVKVPMGVNPDEAVNLAQLTASNPIALNKIVGSKNYPIPAIASTTEFPIELDENTAVAVVPANLLPVVGSVAKVTMFMHTTRSIQGGVYKSLVNSTNLGIGKLGTYSTSNQSVSVYVEVEVILTRTSSTNVSTSSKIREIARANSAAGAVPFFDQTAINTDHAQYAGASDFLTVEIMAQVDAESYIINTSPVLIEKIK